MANDKKINLSEEFLREFKYRAGYVISETPKYRPLVGANEEFDEVPVITNEAGEQEDAPKPEGQEPPAPSNRQPQNAEPTPTPEFDAEAGEQPAEQPMGEPMDNPEATVPMGTLAPEEVENEVDELQNEIIKHNIEAMKGIRDQLDGLNSTIQGLNSKMDVLNADVEEVREPTNAEKLMNKTDVSYPYYFNLNDFWNGNWFDQKNGVNETEKGIRELPDGTYVADFDDLPQKSKIDVQDSFNEI